MQLHRMQSAEQVRTRRAAEANMQRLPGGVQPQPHPQPAGFCHVCFTEDYTDDNLLLEVCLRSAVHVHAQSMQKSRGVVLYCVGCRSERNPKTVCGSLACLVIWAGWLPMQHTFPNQMLPAQLTCFLSKCNVPLHSVLHSQVGLCVINHCLFSCDGDAVCSVMAAGRWCTWSATEWSRPLQASLGCAMSAP